MPKKINGLVTKQSLLCQQSSLHRRTDPTTGVDADGQAAQGSLPTSAYPSHAPHKAKKRQG